MYHSLTDARGDTIENGVDLVMVCYLGIDIASIDMVQVFLYSTSLLEITYLVKSPVWLKVVTIVLSDGILDFFPNINLCLLDFYYSNASLSVHRPT